MTTNRDVRAGAAERNLTEMILKGDEKSAAETALTLSGDRDHVNDLVDTISDAMNIVSDLHEVDRLSLEQVESSERAAEKALEVLRPKLRVEQSRLSGRVLVAALEGEPHTFQKTLLMVMLEVGGFKPLDGGDGVSPGDLAARVSELDPDVVAVPLVTESAAKNLTATTSIISGRSRPHIVAFGRGTRALPQGAVLEADALTALSRIAEFLISKA